MEIYQLHIVNIDTGEEMIADISQLRERGMPQGFCTLDGISKEELWELVKQLYRMSENAKDASPRSD